MRTYLFNRFRVIGVFALLAALSGCNIIGLFLPDDGEKDPPPLSATSVSVYIDDATALLKAQSDLSDVQAEASRAGARNIVTTANLSKNLTEDYAGLAVEGAVASVLGFGNGATYDDAKIEAIDAIMAAYIAALESRLDELQAASPSSRATDAQKTVVSGLLARLAKAAVKSLQLTGVSTGRLPEAAGSAVGSMVSSLGTGGITSEYVNSTVGAIAKAAVETLADSGMTGDAAKALAVQAISNGAVSAATSTGIAGVGASDVGTLVAEISKGASQAAATLVGDNAGSAATFVQSAATGSVAAIAAAATAGTIQADSIASIVAKSVEGASAGVSTAAGSSAAAVVLISAVTQTTSQAATAIAGQDVTVMAKGIAQAASCGAASSLGASISNEQLTGAIVLQYSGGGTIDVNVGDEITAGMADGINEPPTADAGADKTTTVGTAVTLTGTGSDAETLTANLTFVWKVVGVPAASALLLDNKLESASFTFTPDTAGTYTLRLRVWDAGQKYADDLVVVTATAPTGVLEVDSLDATERLALAKDKRSRGWTAAARDDLLILVNKYREDPAVFADGFNELGDVLAELGQKDAAIARYDECAQRYPNDSAQFARSRISKAFQWIGDAAKREDARTLFQSVRDTSQETLGVAYANFGLANTLMAEGNFPEARTAYQAILTSAGANNDLKLNAQLQIAMTYRYAGDRPSLQPLLTAFVDPAIPFLGTGLDENAADWTAVRAKYLTQAYNELVAMYRKGKEKANMLAVVTMAVADVRLADFRRLNVAQNGYGAVMYDFNDPSVVLDNLPAFLDGGNDDCEAYSSYQAGAATGDARAAASAAWAYMHIGNAYDKKADTLDGDELRTASASGIASFMTVIDRYPAIANSRPAANARQGIVSINLWDLGDLAGSEGVAAYAAAFAAADAAVKYVYPDDANPVVYTIAANKMGHVLRQYGWRAKKQSGVDYIQYFRDAIAWYERASPMYYPGVAETESSVLDSKKNRLDCLIGLDKFDEARSGALVLMDNTALSVADRASIAYYVPSAYRRQIQDLASDRNFTDLVALLPDMQDSVENVGNYLSGTDYAGGGKAYAQALLSFVQAVESFSGEVRWDGDRDVWIEEVNEWAAEALAMADSLFASEGGGDPATAFGTLNPAEWYFYDARQARAQLLAAWGWIDSDRYADAIAAYQSLYDDFEAVGYTPRSRLVWLLRDWAYLYDSRGDLVDLWRMREEGKEAEIPAAYAAAMADFQQASTRYVEVAGLDGGDLEPAGQGRAYVDAGRILRRMIDLVREYVQTVGYVPTQADYDDVGDWYLESETMLTTVAGNGTDETEYYGIDNGGVAQRAWRFLGELHSTMAWFMEATSGNDAVAMEPYFRKSVQAYRIAVDSARFPGADPHDLSRSRSELVRRILNLAQTYQDVVPPAGETATTLFDEAYDQLALLIVDPELEDDDRAWSISEFGRSVEWLWNLLDGTLSGGEDLSDAAVKAGVGIATLGIVVDQYGFVEEGRVAAESLFGIAMLHKLVAESGVSNTVALERWTAGKAALDTIIGSYGSFTDWWAVSEANNWIQFFQQKIDNPASARTARAFR